ncbi:MAG: hypothetical protein ACRD2A_07585 [Vicinamibacterales bacterium]
MTWVEGYAAGTIVVSVIGLDSDRRFSVTRFLPPSSRQPYVIADQSAGTVDAAKGAEIGKLLDAAGFWTMPVWLDIPAGEGRLWLIEARQGKRYRVVSRVTPDASLERAARFVAGSVGVLLPEVDGKR